MSSRVSRISSRLNPVNLGEKWFDIFLYLLFISFFIAPFIDSPAVRLLTSLLFSLMMIAGVVTISRHRVLRYATGTVALIAIILRWMKHVVPSPMIFKLGTLAILMFMIILTVMTLAKVFSKGRVTAHRVKGAVAAYLLFGLTWAILYGLLDQLLPGAFSLPAAVDIFDPERQQILSYFSFVTLTTLGYGDIVPTHDISRMFVVMEALCGQLYPATLLARLVSLQLIQGGEPEK